ncbi:MAG: hypothetical protein U9M98_00655 [Patescibacteria group bacterium]|nr:hypothetical protein [Patescibacteria group bacterium]
MIIQQLYAYEIENPTGFNTIGDVIGTVLLNVFIIAGLLLFFYLIFGGFKYLTAGGNEDAVEQAQKVITTAIIGFVIIFMSYWIMWIIQTIFGVNVGIIGGQGPII